MLETILARLGLPILMEVVGAALAKVDHPLAQGTSRALAQTGDAFAQGLISPEAAKEGNRHLERMTEIAGKERSDALAAINESLRTEVSSNDPYVRRMRPTFGYLMAVTWTAQMLALAYIIVFDTAQAAIVLQAVQSLSAIWAVALSVLGIYVYKRSEDKKNLFVPYVDVDDSIPKPSRKPIAGFNR